MAKSIYKTYSHKCPNCGADVPPKSNKTICPYCGSMLVTEVDVPSAAEKRSYSVWHDLDFLIKGATPQRFQLELTFAQLQSHPPYQVVRSTDVYPQTYRNIRDNDGNQFFVFEQTYSPVPQVIRFQIRYQVDIQETRWQPNEGNGSTIAGYTHAEKFIESQDRKITQLCKQITEGKKTPLQKAQAIYNYVGDYLTFSGYSAVDRGALWALSAKNGDCSEFADLYVALCRAAGIPSRWVEGFTANPNASTSKHDWAESYFPGMGWVMVDPTWGRASQNRPTYFAFWPKTHILLTRGRNLPALNNFHYFSYNYHWWGTTAPIVERQERITIS